MTVHEVENGVDSPENTSSNNSSRRSSIWVVDESPQESRSTSPILRDSHSPIPGWKKEDGADGESHFLHAAGCRRSMSLSPRPGRVQNRPGAHEPPFHASMPTIMDDRLEVLVIPDSSKQHELLETLIRATLEGGFLLRRGDIIGSGDFGIVYKVFLEESGKELVPFGAMKEYKPRATNAGDPAIRFRQEVAIGLQLNSIPGVVSTLVLVKCYPRGQNLQAETCPVYELLGRNLQEVGPHTDSAAAYKGFLFLMDELVPTVKLMHEAGYAHGDIKAANVALTPFPDTPGTGGSAESRLFSLIDVGGATCLFDILLLDKSAAIEKDLSGIISAGKALMVQGGSGMPPFQLTDAICDGMAPSHRFRKFCASLIDASRSYLDTKNEGRAQEPPYEKWTKLIKEELVQVMPAGESPGWGANFRRQQWFANDPNYSAHARNRASCTGI